MIRDMDLVRKILFAMEAEPHGFIKRPMQIEGYTDEEIRYHVYLMGEAGLLHAINLTHSGGESPEALPSRLTWAGHDFLDACRDEGRWKEAKEIFRKAGGVTFDVAKQVLVKLAISGVSQYLPGGVSGG